MPVTGTLPQSTVYNSKWNSVYEMFYKNIIEDLDIVPEKFKIIPPVNSFLYHVHWIAIKNWYKNDFRQSFEEVRIKMFNHFNVHKYEK